jgi:hypothetical protein
LGVLLASCASLPKPIVLPSDTGTPLADFSSVHSQVTSACAGVRTLKGELALSGRIGSERLPRTTVIAGFERPSSMRLEGLPPIGGPIFILAARDGSATLLLPREDRIVRNAAPEAILDALTGIALGPADLLAVFTGCVLPAPRPTAGRVHVDGLASIDIESVDQGAVRTAKVYLRRSGSQWQLRAASRDRWQFEYTPSTGQFPQSVRLLSTDPAIRVELTAVLSQIETNVDLDPAAFAIPEQKNLMPMTVEELRQGGPLREK